MRRRIRSAMKPQILGALVLATAATALPFVETSATVLPPLAGSRCPLAQSGRALAQYIGPQRRANEITQIAVLSKYDSVLGWIYYTFSGQEWFEPNFTVALSATSSRIVNGKSSGGVAYLRAHDAVAIHAATLDVVRLYGLPASDLPAGYSVESLAAKDVTLANCFSRPYEGAQ